MFPTILCEIPEYDVTGYTFVHYTQREFDVMIEEYFEEHDLRAKVASDIESEHAQLLLGHSNSEITNRVYRRKAEKTKPTKLQF